MPGTILTSIGLFNPQATLGNRHYPHSADKETKAKRGAVICQLLTEEQSEDVYSVEPPLIIASAPSYSGLQEVRALPPVGSKITTVLPPGTTWTKKKLSSLLSLPVAATRCQY